MLQRIPRQKSQDSKAQEKVGSVSEPIELGPLSSNAILNRVIYLFADFAINSTSSALLQDPCRGGRLVRQTRSFLISQGDLVMWAMVGIFSIRVACARK